MDADGDDRRRAIGIGLGFARQQRASQHVRRSLYLFNKRNVRIPLFEAFDQPDTLNSCAARPVSTFAPQALILMNGRRVVPSGLGADSSVDLGTIPIAMIERVEVLKDGASAIYGSDAESGVVNIITRTDFNGTEAMAYTATSQRGDGTNYELSFVTGHSSKKGNMTFAAGYQDQKSVMAGDRKFADHTSVYTFCNTQELADDKILVNTVCPGAIYTDRLRSGTQDRARRAGIGEEEMVARSTARIPLKRFGTPEEFANMVVFLASGRASYVTGSAIMVDGGSFSAI